MKIPKKFKKYGGEIFDKCLSHCIIAPSSVFLSKEILNQVENDGEIFDEDLEVCEDYDLWLRVASRNEIGLVDEKLITKYAGHEDQLSYKHWGMDRFRVISLEKLFKNKVKENLVKDELIKKYTLLLKGAIKHDKIRDKQIYEIRLRELNELN